MNDLLDAWDSIGSPKMLVIGDIILDRYTWGNAERVSPEAPVLVLKADTHEVRLGGAASVASLLRALDAQVSLAGVIGDDANGRVTRHLLDEAEIDADLVIRDECRPTTAKERFIGRAEGKHPHHVLRVDEECSRLLAGSVEQQLAARILDRLHEFDAVLISDYAKGVFRSDCAVTTFRYQFEERCNVGRDDSNGGFGREGEAPAEPPSRCVSLLHGSAGASPSRKDAPDQTILLKTIIAAANGLCIPVVVDPARLPDCDCYRGATILKPNRAEAELICGGKINTPEAAMTAGETLCVRLDLPAAVITLDRDGMVLSRRNGPSELFPITPRAVCDITGAGDMALAMLGLAVASTKSSDEFPEIIPIAVRLANIASGLEVERLGVTPVDRSEIRRQIVQATGARSGKLTTLDEMADLATQYRNEGKTIVFTNGCFDLLHVGHLTCLQHAARLGDVLVVAINSDNSVRQLKGPDRPVIGEADRAGLLSGLECVDHVLIFSESTPHELLRRIRPDILLKGQTTHEVVGREIVEGYGGRVCVAGLVDGVSTTQLIQRTRATSMVK